MFRKGFQKMGSAGLLALALLSGCAHALSPGVEKAARRDIDFPTVFQDPARYVGSTVIWGGIILATEVKSQSTDLVILETPLGYEQVPADRRSSRGRFIATSPYYLDPAIYRPGLKITVGGEIVGRESRPLGQSQYRYPVLRILDSRLWTPEPPYAYYPYPYGFYGPEFSIGLGWSWWGGGGHRAGHHTGVGFGGTIRGPVR